MPQNQLLFSPKIEPLLVSNITIHLITQDRPQGITLASFLVLPPFYKSDRFCLLPLFFEIFPTLHPTMPACTAITKTLITLRNTSWRFRQEGPFPWVLCSTAHASHKHRSLWEDTVSVTQDVVLSIGNSQPAIPNIHSHD